MTPEGKVKQQIKETLDRMGVYYHMPGGTMYGTSGVSDFECCVCGRYVAIEAKSERGVLSNFQKQFRKNIVKAGGVYLIVRPSNISSLATILEEVINGPVRDTH